MEEKSEIDICQTLDDLKELEKEYKQSLQMLYQMPSSTEVVDMINRANNVIKLIEDAYTMVLELFFIRVKLETHEDEMMRMVQIKCIMNRCDVPDGCQKCKYYEKKTGGCYLGGEMPAEWILGVDQSGRLG